MRAHRSSVLVFAIALGGSHALAANPTFLKTVGPTPDGRGARVVLAGGQLDARTIALVDREVREAYEQLHPHHGSYRVMFGINAEGNVEATALPYAVAGERPSTQAPGAQPPTSPSPSEVPDYADHVDPRVVD
jgi:hypothetical protein